MNKKERLEKGLLKLGEVAEECGISLGTIRHYSNLGLLVPEEYTPGKFRLFDRRKTLERIAFIKKRAGQGISLENIQTELAEPARLKEVLIVDDETEVCEVIEEILKKKPVKTKVVNDGFSAGQLLGEHMPDLVILDLHLPGIDGFEICKKIRNSKAPGMTKILAITGYDSAENAQKILASGADAYLAKPFDIDVLNKTIDSLLNLS